MLKLFHQDSGLISYLPRIEKTTFDVSLVHFLLMFGYKLFSLFYPLYLASVGISLISIGNIYFLTYSIISVSCFLINFYIHKTNPARVAALGIFGYGIFALMMLLSQDIRIFYAAQVVLGISAAAWLVSLKFILMNAPSENRTSSFGWFYAMPSYATALAPAIGGIIIWKFGFSGVFFASVVIQFTNAIYAYLRLKDEGPTAQAASERETASPVQLSQIKRYKEAFHLLNSKKEVVLMLSFIFATLILGGIYRAFFVLLLKDLSYTQEEIIGLTSALAFMYVPFSILVIKIMERLHKSKIATGGMLLEGAASVFLGVFYGALSTASIFVLNLLDSMGALALGSGKSAFFAKKLDRFKEEASTIDSIMTTLGPAIGGLIGGLAVAAWGYQETFFIAGTIVLALGAYSYFFRFDDRQKT